MLLALVIATPRKVLKVLTTPVKSLALPRLAAGLTLITLHPPLLKL